MHERFENARIIVDMGLFETGIILYPEHITEVSNASETISLSSRWTIDQKTQWYFYVRTQ